MIEGLAAPPRGAMEVAAPQPERAQAVTTAGWTGVEVIGREAVTA